MILVGAALALGFIGSLHCVGMCGPLVLSFGQQQGARRFVATRSAYNIGRITTYALLGAVIGSIGESARLFGLQQVLSIAIGAGLLVSVLFIKGRTKLPGITLIYLLLKGAFATLIARKSLVSHYAIGMINGLLPCGLVYMALLAALGFGGFWEGVFFMTVFGLGTVPSLLAVAILGRTAKPAFTTYLRNLTPVITVLLGALLLLRGLGLGIPYLSPDLPVTAIPSITNCIIP